MRRLTLKTCSALPLAGLLLTSVASAEEPRKVSEPTVLREPSEVVQVVDAFDDDDLFDLHLSLGYQSTWKSAKILRESSLTDPTGLFSFDTRFLSTWVLTVGGERLSPLSVDDLQYFQTRFFLVPGTGTVYVDSKLSVVHHRTVGDGFRR